MDEGDNIIIRLIVRLLWLYNRTPTQICFVILIAQGILDRVDRYHSLKTGYVLDDALVWYMK